MASLEGGQVYRAGGFRRRRTLARISDHSIQTLISTTTHVMWCKVQEVGRSMYKENLDKTLEYVLGGLRNPMLRVAQYTWNLYCTTSNTAFTKDTKQLISPHTNKKNHSPQSTRRPTQCPRLKKKYKDLQFAVSSSWFSCDTHRISFSSLTCEGTERADSF